MAKKIMSMCETKDLEELSGTAHPQAPHFFNSLVSTFRVQ